MLIEIPVEICFDARNDGFSRPLSRLFTLRYDLVDTDREAQYCDHFPPRPKAVWVTDKAGILYDLFVRDQDEDIRRRAEADPEAYGLPAPTSIAAE